MTTILIAVAAWVCCSVPLGVLVGLMCRKAKALEGDRVEHPVHGLAR